jgi:hypothetical protein
MPQEEGVFLARAPTAVKRLRQPDALCGAVGPAARCRARCVVAAATPSMVDREGRNRYTTRMGPIANFWAIVSVPDNIPIVFMLILVGYFTYLSFDEARKNDRLIREGRKDQILRRMQD